MPSEKKYNIFHIQDNCIKSNRVYLRDFQKYLSLSHEQQNVFSRRFKSPTSFSSPKKRKSPTKTSKKIIPKIPIITDKSCVSKATLSISAKDELIKLVHNAGKKNKKGKFKHHEVGGLLQLKKTSGGYIVDINKSSYIDGNHDGTNVPKGKAGFHTHPAGEYVRQQVSYAWPSGDDYMAILEKMIDEECVLHIVATKEGIYIVSFSEELAKSDKPTMKSLLKKKATLAYKFQLPSSKEKDISPANYIKDLNRFENKIFTVQFLSWDSVKKGKSFNIYYPLQKSGNCNL